ncbi:hypothetical protein KAR91_10165 [Candidatus Pacearchaeota archaeon]|nr:hypothetical protein [Candidatus Pacearchaeota archaeon]
MRLLFWKEDKKRPQYSGKRFTLLKVRWDVRSRKWIEVTGDGHFRWGLHHPDDGRLIGLKKDPSRYGRVIETPDISVSAVLGTPTAGVAENDEGESSEDHDGTQTE